VAGEQLDAAALTETLGKLKGIHRATLEGDQLLLQAEDANAVLGQVVGTIDKAGGHIKSLKVDEPNLEAVFLHLTGRALRD
jgi:ABC-2 type transport system ATP-binding protein